MLQNCVKDAVKRFGNVHMGVLHEIDNKFFWIMVNSGAKQDYYWLFNKIDTFIEKINEWVDKMAKQGAISKEIDVQDFQKTAFLQYFLQTALAGVISIHDIRPALHYYQLTKDVVHFWLKGIKRVLFVSMKLQPEQVFDIYNYLTNCFEKGIVF